MKKNLYKFQEAALKQIKDRDNVLLAAEMGTGKTLMSIEQSERWDSDILVCLVLKSTLKQWLDELSSQTGRKVFNGYKKTKKDGIKAFIDYDGKKAVVIGYDAYKAKCAALLRDYINKNAERVTMICDESSLIGRMESERTKAVLKSKTKHKILCSGTPCSGGKMENLLPSIKMLGWKMTKEQFLKDYCYVYEWSDPARPWVTIPIIQGYKNIEQLRAGLKEHGTVFLTMEEAGVELPPETTQQIEITTPAEYKKFMRTGIVEIDGQAIIGENNLTRMLYSRQICSVYNQAKAAAVEELLEQAGDEPVIIFYNWTAELKILESICERLKRPISVVNGQKRDLTAYEENRPGTVILAQYQAASMGLNLQEHCRICIYFSPCLSYSDFEQSKARVHRIGQKRNCIFYTLICKESVEESIMQTLAERRDYTEQLFTEQYGPKAEVAA